MNGASFFIQCEYIDVMALLSPLRRPLKLQTCNINMSYLYCYEVSSVLNRYESTFNKFSHKTNKNNSKDTLVAPGNQLQRSFAKLGGETVSYDEFSVSDFDRLSEKYGEETIDNDNLCGKIDIIPVNTVLNDIKKKYVVDTFNTKLRSENASDKVDNQPQSKLKTTPSVSKNKAKLKHNFEIAFTRGNSIFFSPPKKKIIIQDRKPTSQKHTHSRVFHNTFHVDSEKSTVDTNRSVRNFNASETLSDFFKEIEDNAPKVSEKKSEFIEESCSGNTESTRKNCLSIQMLSSSLYDQIFGKIGSKESREAKEDFERSKIHLQDQGLWGKETFMMPNYSFQIPPLEGSTLEQHFYTIAENQCSTYKELLNTLVGADIPLMPSQWQYAPGWTRYNSDGTHIHVEFPNCSALVFDVEVCVKEGNHPILATAMSDKHWYSWCSHHLVLDKAPVSKVAKQDLIPLETYPSASGKTVQTLPKIVVGHNVSFDRIRIREQYSLENSALRFLDTMSLHIAVSGLVSEQRALLMKNKTSNSKVYLPWMSVGCENNLNDVYKFYCYVKDDLKKDMRNIFVKGCVSDVRDDFQNLMSYCAEDVKATYMVLRKLLPLFFERFPHPVTFAGMLEMGSTFLPVTHNWTKYVEASESKYQMLERLLNEELVRQSQDALSFKENERYKQDPWLWNLDWSVPKGRVRSLPGYPTWYRKLCARTGERVGTPEPENMSTSLQVVPKVLRLTWNGFPLHYERKYGWGFLKPLFKDVSEIRTREKRNTYDLETNLSDVEKLNFPVEAFYEICSKRKISVDEVLQGREKRKKESPETEEDWEKLIFGEHSQSTTQKQRKTEASTRAADEERSYDIGIDGVAFVPLPHKDGPSNRVGNPLAKDYLNKIEDNILSSYNGDIAKLVLQTSKTLSYWKNNRDRILSQMVIWNDEDVPENLSTYSSEDEKRQKYGIIIPMVVSAGTITRRAVERTWMTASNAYADRIGSELKAMIEAPPGYNFVGADVDSQELWIAAILGDAYFSCEHGGTALGWMTLQGKKSEGTDMHSRTASLAGISRDHAKVINYGRIYGAGVKFMQRLLKQFNPRLTDVEAQSRAVSLFEATKGKKGWVLSENGEALASEIYFPLPGEVLSRKEVNKLVRMLRQNNIEAAFEDVVVSTPIWVGGSESHMFNCLEAIARSDKPKTPVLGARMTRALEPDYVDDQFMTSRVNWVVQSSAVDYLHLMLVSMQWLFQKYNIKGRFCISIHDEVRYLVASEDRYRAALALQITNLLTRSLFACRLGFRDLPQSVAFFSSIDIDTVLRKEPHFDCITPSNPEGLLKGYGIQPGESLDIGQILDLTERKLQKTRPDENE
ncbi:hypothetical protein SK128_016079 [Halocaridina rubra]|uniref:DNA polymerase subunit gamma-1 n=1 Tax=Halocaridina rubra TaxID=373956 RepID=A0AAN9FUF7_HALRR